MALVFASGKVSASVAVSDGIKVFNDMKVRKSSMPEEVKKRKRAIVLFPTPPLSRCCRIRTAYALYGTTYETKESNKEDLMSIFWSSESAPLRSKIINASSEDTIKKKLTGIKHELQANRYEEVKGRCTEAEKLGGSAVISLEDKPS
ncbi:hypothetical protein P7K49_011073 [Saguinus oedipus]|uniref:ADF-H domain-containing protein n=1 Tax=Saguinus oedipus TaxID=9490 RepID=A0ABQ9VPY1_SAGOE|nr:hypothetical protein P7K49_011073 [Saguinus oedipus]